MKERIIGAVVLVVFVVLVVPIFLDGPPEVGEIVSERVLLPGQENQETKTVVLDRERSEPIPTATAPQPVDLPRPDANSPAVTTAEPDASIEPLPAAPVVKAPQAAPEKQAEARSAVESTTGMWAVQLGSFSNRQNAEKLAADLRKQGYAAFLSQLKTGTGELHRVRIGPQKDREGAEAMAVRLQRVGHKGQVLPHP